MSYFIDDRYIQGRMCTEINVHPFCFRYITIYFGIKRYFEIKMLRAPEVVLVNFVLFSSVQFIECISAFPFLIRWRVLSSIENYFRNDFLCVSPPPRLFAFTFIPQLVFFSVIDFLFAQYTFFPYSTVILCHNENQL